MGDGKQMSSFLSFPRHFRRIPLNRIAVSIPMSVMIVFNDFASSLDFFPSINFNKQEEFE